MKQILLLLLYMTLASVSCSQRDTDSEACPDASPVRYGVRELSSSPRCPQGEEPLFYNIWRAHLLEDETLVVLDRGDYSIKHVTLQGTILRSFGGKGSGPGEFRNFTASGIVSSEMVMIVDINNMRSTCVGLNDNSVETFSLSDMLVEDGVEIPFAVTDNGHIILYIAQYQEDTGHITGNTRIYHILEITREGKRVREFIQLRDDFRNQRLRLDSGTRQFTSPFAPNLAQLVHGHLLYLHMSLDYRIHVFDLDTGQQLPDIQVDSPKMAVTRNDVIEVIGLERFQQNQGLFEIPETRSFVRSLTLIDSNGYLWILRYPSSLGAEAPSAGEKHYDLLDPETGQIIGSVRTPNVRAIGEHNRVLYAWSNSIADQGILLKYALDHY